MNFMRLFHNLERVEQFKTRYQKYCANDEDELERYGFFKKSKTRFTKHDDQSKEHHHERENLDHCEVDAWWFDPCVLCWTSGHVPDDWRVSAGYHEKGRPGSHMKRVIAVQEEPSLHVNPTRERCPGLNADTMEASHRVNLFKKFKTACPRMSRAG